MAISRVWRENACHARALGAVSLTFAQSSLTALEFGLTKAI